MTVILWLTCVFQFTTTAALHRRLPWTKMLIHWAVTFLGNLAGSLFIVAIIFGCKYPSRPAVAFHIDVANNRIEQPRRQRILSRTIQISSDLVRDQKASNTRIPHDLLAWHRMQLASMSSMLFQPARPRPSIKSDWHLVAHIRIRFSRFRPRCCQYDVHPDGDLGRSAEY